MPSGYWSKAPTKELRMAVNASRPCKMPGCNNLRRNYSGVCTKHSNSDERYGHGLCTKVPIKVLEQHRGPIRRLLEKNREHPRIEDAMAQLDRYLRSSKHEPLPHGRDLFRLHNAGVTATDILIEAATVYLIEYEDNSMSYVRDRRSLVTQVGHVCLRLAPTAYTMKTSQITGAPYRSYKGHSGGKRRAFGTFILRNFEPVLVSLVTAVVSSRKVKEEREKKRNQPLELDLGDD